MERIGQPVSAEAHRRCLSVLEAYPNNFRPPGPDPCTLRTFRIVLKDKTKFHVCLPRRVNEFMLAEIRKQVEELVAAGTVERCTTAPGSLYAIVMAKKPGAPGKYRLCVDMVELNKNTEPMPYAVPDLHEALDRLSGHKYYCTFDFTGWFHQFELAEEDRDKVAFLVPGDNISPPQIYRYKRLAMGLLNSTYWSQRCLQEALETFPGCRSIYPFVDDIVLAADSLDEMVEKLEAFMKFCQHYNIRLKREKTELATSAVKHLGFILSEEGQSLDPARVSTLLSIGAPKNLKGLKSLLGSFGFIRGWLADMASTAKPLTDLMGSTARRMGFIWGQEQEDALAALKLAVQLAPAKVAADFKLPFHIFVDASDVGVAAVLVQYRMAEDGTEKPFAIMHFSRRWSAREAKWSVSEREMYGIRYGFFKFKPYIQGHPDVTMWSDHLNLVTGLWTHASPKIERWRLFIESMQPFKLKHIKGASELQSVADSLSRLHVDNLKMERTVDELDPECVLFADRAEGELPGDDDLAGEGAGTTCSVPAAMHSIMRVHHANNPNPHNALPRERVQQCEEDYGLGAALLRKMGWDSRSDKPFVTLKPSSGRRGVGWKDKHGGRGSHFNSITATTPLGDTDKDNTTRHTITAGNICSMLGIPAQLVRDVQEREEEETEPAAMHTRGASSSKNHNVTYTHPPTTPQQQASGIHVATQLQEDELGAAAADATTAQHAADTVSDFTSTSAGGKQERSMQRTATNPQQDGAHTTLPAGVSGEVQRELVRLQQFLHMRKKQQEGEGKKNRRVAFANTTSCGTSQTEPEDLLKAKLQSNTRFLNRQTWERVHDDTHPSFMETWRRVVRTTGVPLGAEGARFKEECRRWCDGCIVCQKIQPARRRLISKIGNIRSRPFSQLAFDLIVLSGSEDKEGHRYILTVTDSFTHAVELFPLKKATAESVTSALHDILCRFGNPHEVRHDNGKQFTAAVVARLLKLTKIKQHATAPYSHWSNGQIENANRRIMQVLRVMILSERLGPLTEQRWSLLCPAVRRIINARMVQHYGCTPNDLIYVCPDGANSIFEEEAWIPEAQVPAELAETERLIETLKEQHLTLIDICETMLDEQVALLAVKNELYVEETDQLQPGETVLVDSRERPHKKVAAGWFGPYLVIEQHQDQDGGRPMVTLQHLATKKTEDFHTSMCKRCDLGQLTAVDEAVKHAAKDMWEYEIEAILDHEPKGLRRRKVSGKWQVRRKSDYSFQVLWKDWPRDEANPSWEPWSNESMKETQVYSEYCKRSDVLEQLGADFLAREDEDEEQPASKRRSA